MTRRLLVVPLFVMVLALSVSVSLQSNGIHANIEDHLPNDTIGPVGNVYASYKFDDGFYDKIQEMINTVPQDGAPNVYDGKIYHDIIFVVSRDDGDQRNPDDVAAENKESLAKNLNNVGAFNIRQGDVLSFVTASVPVTELPGLSLHDEIFGVGDGALAMFTSVDTARITINATPDEIRATSGIAYNGSGVAVGVLDTGINHATALNPKVIDRVVCDNNGCTPANLDTSSTSASHGTQVAHVLAATLSVDGGIAPGVQLLDVDVLHNNRNDPNPNTIQAAPYVHGLDWSLKNGADVTNLSFGNSICARDADSAQSLILNEAVDKGMVVVGAAGNSGSEYNRPNYNSILNPQCAHNSITVGGINDRTDGVITMYVGSSRGPVSDDMPRLKPDVVAPAVNIDVLNFTTGTVTTPRTGTSYAAPQVSATAAIILQAKPDFTPAEIKAAILLGADWQAPVPCTSTQFEINNVNDNCSYARQPTSPTTANNAASLGILNNVGFGILNVNQTLEYVSERTPTHNHVLGDYLDADTNSRQYTFQVTDTSEPVKVILTWFVHPHGGITEQAARDKTPHVANLGFTIQTPTGQTIDADSAHQTSEFAVFNPSSVGTYTVTVTGSNLDKINKPIQNYALASTNSLALLPAPFLNRAPVANADTIIINPVHEDPAIIRLTGSDQNGDPISFSVSKDPSHGTVSTDEQITKTSSRMFYNASSAFATQDTFEITPQDGLVAGRPAIITIRAESLPSGSNGDAMLDSTTVKKWDTLEVRHGYAHTKYSTTFSGPDYPVSAIYLGSVNMEGVDAQITTTSGVSHTAAVPPSGDRMITFSSPLSIRSVVLSADGLNEESAHDITAKKPVPRKSVLHSTFLYDDVRMFAGYVPAACTGGTVSGAQGSSLSCPAHVTFDASSAPNLDIPDNSDAQDTSDTILMPVNGTLKSVSVSVDISHTYTGDLKVEMSSPSGKTVILHNREGAGTDDIKKMYDSATFTALKTLLDTAIAGNWTISIGDYAGGDVGTLNSWSLSAQYEPFATMDTTQGGNTITVFSDDFEDGTLAKWTETGDGEWMITTSQAESVPTIPGYQSSNMVLHADDCDSTCTVTTKQAIDLSDYKSATLSFWRFVDRSLDGSEYLKVDVSDGSSWSTILHWSDNNNGDDGTWHKETYDLAKYVGKSSVAIRFVTQQSYTNEDVQVDDIVISANKSGSTISPPPPPPPTNTYSVYVADTDDYEILAYTPEGAYINDIVPRKSGGLGKPFDVAFGPSGHLYVSDITHTKIRKYNGNTGAPLGTTSGNAEWASVASSPSGLFWNGNTLYVSTLKGIERISLSGSSLGLFGDASRTPTTQGAPKLASPYDVTFCPDGNMYVADRALDSILYYDGTTGKYKGTVPSAVQSTQKPDTDNAVGLECGPAVAGTSGTTSLFQSGGDPGRINEINPTTRLLVRQFTSLIDEPYGIDSDASGNLYIANKDDNNIVKISPAGTSLVFATGGLDDPRGVSIGPKHTAPSSSSSGDAHTVPPAQHNDGPDVTLQNSTHDVSFRIEVAQNSTAIYTITATDPEDDPIEFALSPYAVEGGTILLVDHRNATATISLDTSGMDTETYAFEITASDGHNIERAVYAIVVR